MNADWTDDAPCRTAKPANMTAERWARVWFPGSGGEATTAKNICAECPYQDACRDTYDTLSRYEQRHGIWYGTTFAERRRTGGLRTSYGTRRCAICRDPFVARTSTGRYCTDPACKAAGHRRLNAAAVRRYQQGAA